MSETIAIAAPPEKACCITVKPISITISTRPPSSAGPTMSLVTTPVTARLAGEHPHDQQQPGRDQQHRAVEAVRREIDDEAEARDRHDGERHARDAGGDRRIEHRDRGERAEEHEPAAP